MSKVIRTKENYIKALEWVLAARPDFKSLKYNAIKSTGKEYLFLYSLTGEVFIFDVSGYTENDILDCLAGIIAANDVSVAKELITDREERMTIGKLFLDA